MLVIDILRHGEAAPAAAFGGDRERRLSAAGASRIAELAEELEGSGWRPDRLFSSSLARARQTAEIVARAAGPGGPEPETLEALEPDAEPEDVLKVLSSLGLSSGHIVLVGHQPLLGRLAARLTGIERKLPPGTLVRVRCPNGPVPGGGTTVLTLSPGPAA